MIPVKRCYLCLGLFAAGLLLLLGSALLARYALLEAPAPLFVLGALFLAAGVIYRIVRFRCPHCEGTVFPAWPRRGKTICCPKCGQPTEYR